MSTDVEARFDQLTDRVVIALTQVRGDASAEEATLEEVVRRYGEIRREVEPDEPWSYVTHFLAADGIALGRARTPAFARLAATAAEGRRWSEHAGDVAMRLESESLAGR